MQIMFIFFPSHIQNTTSINGREEKQREGLNDNNNHK